MSSDRLFYLPLGGAGGVAQGGQAPLFLRISGEIVTLNGRPLAPEELAAALKFQEQRTVLVSVTEAATSQDLADVLSNLRGIENIAINVLVPA